MRKNFCRYFFTPSGCTKGRNCKFSHGDEYPQLPTRMTPVPQNPPLNRPPNRQNVNNHMVYVPPYPNYPPPPYYQTPRSQFPTPLNLPYTSPLPQTHIINSENDIHVPIFIKKCVYYFSPRGCRHGKGCTHSHEKYNAPCQVLEREGRCSKDKHCPFHHFFRYKVFGHDVPKFTKRVRPKKQPIALKRHEENEKMTKSLLECPPDTIAFISNFFRRISDGLNFMYTCKTIRTIFSNPNFNVLENIWFKPPQKVLPKASIPFVRRFRLDLTTRNLTNHQTDIIKTHQTFFHVREYIHLYPNLRHLNILFSDDSRIHQSSFLSSILTSLTSNTQLFEISFSHQYFNPPIPGEYPSFPYHPGQPYPRPHYPQTPFRIAVPMTIPPELPNEKNEKKLHKKILKNTNQGVRTNVLSRMLRNEELEGLREIKNLQRLSFSMIDCFGKSLLKFIQIPKSRMMGVGMSMQMKNRVLKSFFFDRKSIEILKSLKSLKELDLNDCSFEIELEDSEYDFRFMKVDQMGRDRKESGDHFKKVWSNKVVMRKELEEWRSLEVIRVHRCYSKSLTVELLLLFPNVEKFQICGCGKMYDREELRYFERVECSGCESKMKPFYQDRGPPRPGGKPKEGRLACPIFHLLPKKRCDEVSDEKEKKVAICGCFDKCGACRNTFAECSMCVCGRSQICYHCKEKTCRKPKPKIDNGRFPKSYETESYAALNQKIKICGGCGRHYCNDCIKESQQCNNFSCHVTFSCPDCRAKKSTRCSLCHKKRCLSTPFGILGSSLDFLGSSGTFGIPYLSLQKDSHLGCTRPCEVCETNGWCLTCLHRILSTKQSEDTPISKWTKVSNDFKICVFRCRCGAGYKFIEQGEVEKTPQHHRYPPYPRIQKIKKSISKMSDYEVSMYFEEEKEEM